MTCLTLIRTAWMRLGLANAPTAVVTSQDPQVLQFLALANEEGQALAEATNWQALTVETSFVTLATEIQGTLATIAPGCKFIVNDTIWNRSLRMPVFGPLVAQTWQQQKAMYLQGPWNQFRVVNNSIKFLPTPVAGQNCFFEYVTKNWALDAGGVIANSTFQADTDTARLDEDVMVMGLIWRFRQAKGLDFSADLEKYSRRVSDLVARETPKPMLDMGDSFNDIPPVVILPAGSWGP